MLIKQLFSHFINRLCAITLYIAFSFFTVSVASGGEETTVYSQTGPSNPYDYLTLFSDLPVDYLFSFYHATGDLLQQTAAKRHPFFTALEYKRKTRFIKQSIIPLYESGVGLNHLLSYDEGIRYIDNGQLISVVNIPLYEWILKRYSSVYYKDNNNISLLTVTIEGMLFDLNQRSEKGDAAATIALEFLKRPYVKVTSSKSDNNQLFVFRWVKSLYKLLSEEKALSFEERLAMLPNESSVDEQSKFERLVSLAQRGHQYQKNYTFISYTKDDNGKKVPVSSDDIIYTEAEVEKALDDNYSGLSIPVHQHEIVDDKLPASSTTIDMQASPSTFSKLCGATFAAMCFCSMINSGLSLGTPPRCTEKDSCHPQNHSLLFNHNFTEALQNNPTGHFKLAERVTLSEQQNLPLFPNCTSSFSGILETGNHVLNIGYASPPLFDCINGAEISGNLGVCVATPWRDDPVIANQVFNNSIVNIKQAGACYVQRPVFGDIAGHHNQIAFTAIPEPEKTVSANHTGVIANTVSGDNNKIVVKEGKWFETPVVVVAGGNDNTYIQKDMKITRTTNSVFEGHKFLVANQFSGDNTTIIQDNIDATLTTQDATSDFRIPDATVGDPTNKAVSIFSSNAVIKVQPQQDLVRMTNVTDSSPQRSTVTNNGRLEICKNGVWKPVCEETLGQGAAEVACRSMGFETAKNEGDRLRAKRALSPVKLNTSPIHAENCTGYEQRLNDCISVNTINKACPQNQEAFLSCSDEVVDLTKTKTRLTDFNSINIRRHDTTNTHQGRLEQQSPSGKLSTVCTSGFDNDEASVACRSMGYIRGGHIANFSAAPLPEEVPVLALEWRCYGNETSLLQCPYGNLTNHHCTHNNDVVLRCNKETISDGGTHYIRLTDRHSHDEYRAVVSKTGFGRIELLLAPAINHRYGLPHQPHHLPFCSNETISDAGITCMCSRLGFRHGIRYYSDTESIPVHQDYQSNRTVISTDTNCHLQFAAVDNVTISRPQCKPGEKNIVILCYTSLDSPQVIAKQNIYPDKIADKSILFSGEFEWIKKGCEPDECPVQFWDASGVKASTIFQQRCNGTQQLHTTNPDDWMKIWGIRCDNEPDDCSCHLPNQHFLGLVSQNNNLNDTLIVARQQYPYNKTSNPQGLVQISKLFSKKVLQLLHPINESLVDEMSPVNQIVIKQHLFGLYSGAEKAKSVQLYWSSLKKDNDVYHAQTFPADGTPILLTNNSVFVKNADNAIISRYQLDITTAGSNITELTIGNMPAETITFPDQTTDIFNAAVKNEWLYVGATNDAYANKAYIMRYNTTEKSWDCGWQQAFTFQNSEDLKLVINDANVAQFFFRQQLSLTDPVLVSIPDFGGCVSFSGQGISAINPDLPGTSQSTIPEAALNSTSECNEQGNDTVALAVTIPSAFLSGMLGTTGCISVCCRIKQSNNWCKPEEQISDDNTEENYYDGDTENRDNNQQDENTEDTIDIDSTNKRHNSYILNAYSTEV